jgi:nucleoid DNA-binding protein
MNKNKLIPILEHEQSEDSDFRLEQIFEFLFENVKETLEDGENNNHRADLPSSKTQR